MRKKIDSAPMFPVIISNCDLKVVADFQEKYDEIGKLLDANPAILDAVHGDIATGSARRRENT